MPINLKIFLLVVEFCFFIMIISNIRKKRLLLKYSLLWLGAILVMTIAIIFPQMLTWVCKLLEIELVSNLVFLLGVLILIVLSFSLTIIVSDLKKKIILLIEEVGILQNKLEGEKDDKKINR